LFHQKEDDPTATFKNRMIGPVKPDVKIYGEVEKESFIPGI